MTQFKCQVCERAGEPENKKRQLEALMGKGPALGWTGAWQAWCGEACLSSEL